MGDHILREFSMVVGSSISATDNESLGVKSLSFFALKTEAGEAQIKSGMHSTRYQPTSLDPW